MILSTSSSLAVSIMTGRSERCRIRRQISTPSRSGRNDRKRELQLLRPLVGDRLVRISVQGVEADVLEPVVSVEDHPTAPDRAEVDARAVDLELVGALHHSEPDLLALIA